MEEELKKVKSDYQKLGSKYNKLLAKSKKEEIKELGYKGLILGLIIGLICNILIVLFS